MNGVLEFVDTQDMTVMSQTEHFMATDVEWDPTGRYVASAVSWWGHKVSSYLPYIGGQLSRVVKASDLGAEGPRFEPCQQHLVQL